MADEPRKGEHWAGSALVVLNPDWPSGYESYLILCPGCAECNDEDA